jgi:hypothetical protein
MGYLNGVIAGIRPGAVGLMVALVLGFAALPGRTYYVSRDGDDHGDGSLKHPWRSTEPVNAYPFGPGDQVLFHGGHSFAGNIVFDRRRANGITLSSYAGGRATIDAGIGTGISVRDLADITIEDLVVRGTGASNRGTGIDVRNDAAPEYRLDWVRIENVEVSGFRDAGIYVGGTLRPDRPPQRGFRHVRINRCNAHENVYYGIRVSGPFDLRATGYSNEDVVISDSVAHDNPGDPEYRDKHSGSGIYLENVTDGRIERCVAYHNGSANGSKGGGPVGIWAHNATGVTITSCLSYRNRTGSARDGGGFDFDGGVSHAVMEHNLSYENDGPGYLVWNYVYSPHSMEHIVVRDNCSVSDAQHHGYGAIHIGSGQPPLRDVLIYHNTVIAAGSGDTARTAVVSGAFGGPLRFWNNLFVGARQRPLIELSAAEADVRFEGNAYWATDGVFAILDRGRRIDSLEEWRRIAGQEMRDGESLGLWGNPRLTTDEKVPTCRLAPDSPLIGRALDLRLRFGVDPGESLKMIGVGQDRRY